MKLLKLTLLSLALGGCTTGVTVGDRSARGPVSGSAAGGNAVGTSTQLASSAALAQ